MSELYKVKAGLLSAAAAAADILVEAEVADLESAAAEATNPDAGEESNVNPAATSRRKVIDMGREKERAAQKHVCDIRGEKMRRN